MDRNLTLNPGDPLSPTAITDTQRRLYDLGVFARVDAAIQNPDGDTDRKYVLYNMEEARALLDGGGLRRGAGRASADARLAWMRPPAQTGFSPRVSFDIDAQQSLGLAHSISLRTRVSTLDQRALLNYTWPRFRNSDKLTLSFTGLYEDSHDMRTFTS